MMATMPITFVDILMPGGNYCGTNIPVWMKGESETAADQKISASRFVEKIT